MEELLLQGVHVSEKLFFRTINLFIIVNWWARLILFWTDLFKRPSFTTFKCSQKAKFFFELNKIYNNNFSILSRIGLFKDKIKFDSQQNWINQNPKLNFE